MIDSLSLVINSKGSSQPRDRTWVSHMAGRFFTIWATREVPVSLFSDTLFNIIIDSLMLNSGQQHCNSCLNEVYRIHAFSLRHTQPSRAWEPWTAPWPWHVRAVFNSEVNGRHKNEGKCGSKWAMKTMLLTVWEMKQEDRVLLHVPWLGASAAGNSRFWPLWAGQQVNTKASQVLIWGLQMDFSK